MNAVAALVRARYPFIGFQIHRTGEPEIPVLKDGRGPAHGDYLFLETDVYNPGQTSGPSALPLQRPIPLPPGEYSVQAGLRLDWHPQSPTLDHDQWTTNTTVTIGSAGDTALDIESRFAGQRR